MRDLVNQARDQARKKPCNLGWKIRIKILYPSRISPLLPESLHSLQFFRKIVRIKRLPVRTAILVSYVPRGRALGFKAVVGGKREQYFSLFLPNHPRPLSGFDTHARWLPITQSARSRRSYGKIGDCEQSITSSAFRTH